MKKAVRIAICGAAGPAGSEALSILNSRPFPVSSVIALDSAERAGVRVPFGDGEITVRKAEESAFDGVDIAFFFSGRELAKKFAPAAQDAGCVAIDATGAWSADPRCPLVIPEVNADTLASHNGIIASPSCPSISLLTVLAPLHKAAGIRRIVVTALHAVSESGQEGIDELDGQIRRIFNMQSPAAELYPAQIAFNCLPHVSDFQADDTEMEIAIAEETRRILSPEISVAATCARVPVFYGHSDSVNVEFANPLSETDARMILMEAPGIQVADNPRAFLYPTAVDASGEDDVFVGRIRRDGSRENCLSLWIAADNTRKGAALNAVQIAGELLSRDLLGVSRPGAFPD